MLALAAAACSPATEEEAPRKIDGGAPLVSEDRSPPTPSHDTGVGVAADAGAPVAFDDDAAVVALDSGELDAGELDTGEAPVECSGGDRARLDETSGRCYLFFEHDREWDRAEDYCSRLIPEAHLATITSTVENALVTELARGVDVWIGATDFLDEGTFSWVDGDPFGPYLAWRQGEPNDRDNEDCLLLDAPRGGWDDRGCGELHEFVCERYRP